MKLIFYLQFCYSVSVYCQSGFLDPSFDFDGKVNTGFGNNSSEIVSSALIQPDNKIVIAAYLSNLTTHSVMLLRYNENGSLDSTFSSDGIATANFTPNNSSSPSSILLQPDSKIVVAGNWSNNLGDQVIGLARFRPNGILDNSFSLDGLVFTYVNDPGSNRDDAASAIVLDSNRKIWLTGQTEVNFGSEIILIRYNVNGSIDTTTKSYDGIIRIRVDSTSKYTTCIARAIGLQNDGKVLIGGSKYDGDYKFLLIRRNTDGSIDSSFNNKGHIVFDFGLGWCEASSIYFQPGDEKILIAGYTSFSPSKFAVARINIDGTFDTTFGKDGRATYLVGSTCVAKSIIVQSDGKILIAGNTGPESTRDFVLMRLNQDGSIDSTFVTNGIIITDFNNTSNECQAMAIQNDGKKVVLAGHLKFDAMYDVVAARYVTGINVKNIDTKLIESEVIVFPNPTFNEISIKSSWPDLCSLTLYDCSQRLLTNQNFTNSMSFNTEHLANGIYFYEVRSKSRLLKTGKFVKE